MEKQNSKGRPPDEVSLINVFKNGKFIFAILIMLMGASCKKEVPIQQNIEESTVTRLAVSKSKDKEIFFAGQKWIVRATSNGSPPGPNNWNSDNVWKDSKGRLHLKLSKNPKTGEWECAEVYTKAKFKYGRYQWHIEGRVDQLDKNVVFGLFNYSGNDYYDEMDIEFARWGSGSKPNLNYTVWPKTGTPGDPVKKKWTDTERFSLSGTYTTHRFTRTSSSVKFQSLHGFQNGNTGEFGSANCTKSFISTASMPVYMNLWLFKGKAPSNNKKVEIIIHDFSFKN